MRKRHSVNEIMWIISQIEKGDQSAGAACARHGITRMTYYRWLKKYRGNGLIHANRTDLLEAENAQLKILVAEQALSIWQLKEMNSKNGKPCIKQSYGGSSVRLPELSLVESHPSAGKGTAE